MRTLSHRTAGRVLCQGLASLMIGITACLTSVCAQPSVPQWHRFEGILEAARAYADPFRDVTLAAEFTRPDGSPLALWGFHDGGRTWRFRTMADQVGTWTYRARFSDGSAETRGTFEVTPSTRPGMLEVHAANPVWFGRRGGGAHLVRAFHAGDRFFAANWPEEERRRFLGFAREQGYTMLSVASHYLNRSGGNRGAGWETPDLWPLNPAEYARMERILDECAAHGLDVYPFAGFFGKNSDAPRDPRDQELYVRYTLARLGAFANIILNVAGPEPNLANNVYLESQEVDRLGRLIQSCNIQGHPLSVHNETGDDEYKHASWTTYGTLQGPKTLNRVELGRGLRKNHHWAKPLFAQETLWTGNRNHPAYPLEDLRKNAWVILFSGTNFCFADNDGNSSTGFSGTLDPTLARTEAHALMRGVWDRFEALPFGRLRPDYTVGGGGWCLSDGEATYLLYFDRTPESPAPLKLPAGATFQAQWLDPRSAGAGVSAAPVRDGDAPPPPAGGDDWILHLSRAQVRTGP